MKRVNDDPYYPVLEPVDPKHKIPRLSARELRRWGLIEGDPALPHEAKSQLKSVRRAAKAFVRKHERSSSKTTITRLNVPPSKVHKSEPPRLRPKLGRPYQETSASFYAFVFVRGQRNLYRAKFGVKRVPATETDKFIGCALRWWPKASENRVREHLSKSNKLIP